MSFGIALALNAIIFHCFGLLPVSASAADVTCYWCSSIVGGKVYSDGCKAKSDNVNNTLQSCQGRTCLLAKAVVKDSGKAAHYGRACSKRPLLTTEKYPAADFVCSDFSDVEFDLTVCYCSKDLCNRDEAVLKAETAHRPVYDSERALKTNTDPAYYWRVEKELRQQAGQISVEQFYDQPVAHQSTDKLLLAAVKRQIRRKRRRKVKVVV